MSDAVGEARVVSGGKWRLQRRRGHVGWADAAGDRRAPDRGRIGGARSVSSLALAAVSGDGGLCRHRPDRHARLGRGSPGARLRAPRWPSPSADRRIPAQPDLGARAPTAVTAVAGPASATITWTAPASDGGSRITGYRISPSSGRSVTVGDVSDDVITGLVDGTVYTFTVAAVNAVGSGPASAPSNPVTPVAAPAQRRRRRSCFLCTTAVAPTG